MNNKPEHTADISAELRTLSRDAKLYGLQSTVYGKPISIYLAELADRIDVASVGNCAAMRHAIAIAVGDLQSNLEMTPDERQFMARYLKAAIDKPARNCDKFQGDIEELREACLRERGLNPDEDFPEIFCEWLLAAAKKGGAQ